MFERSNFFPYTLYVLCAPKNRTPCAPAFSINCMLPPSPSSLAVPLSLETALCVICGKGEARRVQPDYKQLYLYQSPEQAFALDLSSPWEGARGRNRKTRKAYFAFVVFHGRGSEWYTKYHPSSMQQQHITQQQKNNMGKYLMV